MVAPRRFGVEGNTSLTALSKQHTLKKKRQGLRRRDPVLEAYLQRMFKQEYGNNTKDCRCSSLDRKVHWLLWTQPTLSR